MFDTYLITAIIVSIAVLSGYAFMVSFNISQNRRLQAERVNTDKYTVMENA